MSPCSRSLSSLYRWRPQQVSVERRGHRHHAQSEPERRHPAHHPGNLFENNWGNCEVELDWDESTDDLDPQWILEYEVYVNEVYDHSTSLRFTRTIVYGNRNGANDFAVIAVDTAGNRSDAATVIANLNCGF
jgi:hypothetical protein